MDMTSGYTPSYYYPYIYTTLLWDALQEDDFEITLSAQNYPYSQDLQ